MKTMKKLLVISLLAVLALCLCACGADTSNNDELNKITVALDWTPNTNHTGLYVAQEMGYYTEAGLAVEIQSAPEDGAEALVAAGKAQFGISFQDSMGNALCNDLPITAVAAIIQHNTSGLISAAANGITDFAKLEGHNYAGWGSPIEEAIISQVMKDQNADFSKVELIPSTVTDAISALSTNIDTIWVYEAWDKLAVELAGIEYNYLPFADANPVLDYYTPVIISNNQFLADDANSARSFLEATAKGYKYAIENPDAAADILLKYAPELDAELVKASQNFLAAEYQAEAANWGHIDEARWTAFYDWMFEQGLIEKELHNTGFSNDYLN